MTPNEQDPFFNRERSRWAHVIAAAYMKLDGHFQPGALAPFLPLTY